MANGLTVDVAISAYGYPQKLWFPAEAIELVLNGHFGPEYRDNCQDWLDDPEVEVSCWIGCLLDDVVTVSA